MTARNDESDAERMARHFEEAKELVGKLQKHMQELKDENERLRSSLWSIVDYVESQDGLLGLGVRQRAEEVTVQE